MTSVSTRTIPTATAAAIPMSSSFETSSSCHFENECNDNKNDFHHDLKNNEALRPMDVADSSADVASSSSSRHHEVPSGGTLWSAILGGIKGMVGPAILYLPHGFSTTGYAIAIPIMIISTIMYIYSSQCLLEAWSKVSASGGGGDEEALTATTRTKNTATTPIVTMSARRKSNHDDQEERLQRLLSHGDDHHDHHHDPLLLSSPPTSPITTAHNSPIIPTTPKTSPTTPTRTPISISYASLAYQAFGNSILAQRLVQLGIALMQSGVCLTYMMFVPQNLHSSLLFLFDINISPQVLLWTIMVLWEIPLSWMTQISNLSFTNAMANLLIGYGLMVCLGYAIEIVLSNESEDGNDSFWNRLIHLPPTIASSSSNDNNVNDIKEPWFLFIGTSVLLFEGSITLLLPLQESISRPNQRTVFQSIYPYIISSIIVFYIVFGITCWVSFGSYNYNHEGEEENNGNNNNNVVVYHMVPVVLTTALPSGIWATTVQLFYSMAVLMTFPLQHFPALEIYTEWILSFQQDGKKDVAFCHVTSLSKRSIISTCFVIGLAIVATTSMNYLDKVVSLMGSLLGCPIAFCIPPMIHSQLCCTKNDMHDMDTITSSISTDSSSSSLWWWKGKGRRMLNYMVTVAGFCAMIIASIATIVTW